MPQDASGRSDVGSHGQRPRRGKAAARAAAAGVLPPGTWPVGRAIQFFPQRRGGGRQASQPTRRLCLLSLSTKGKGLEKGRSKSAHALRIEDAHALRSKRAHPCKGKTPTRWTGAILLIRQSGNDGRNERRGARKARSAIGPAVAGEMFGSASLTSGGRLHTSARHGEDPGLTRELAGPGRLALRPDHPHGARAPTCGPRSLPTGERGFLPARGSRRGRRRTLRPTIGKVG